MKRAPARLVTRVVVSTIVTAAIGGALTATAAVVAVDRLVSSHADQRLHGAAVTLAGELEENAREGEHEPLVEVLADENDEIVTSGIRLAVFAAGERIAGDARVPAVDAGSCDTRGELGGRVRACAVQYGALVLTAAQTSDAATLRWTYALAGLGALVMSGIMGALVSARLTRWALRPVTELRDRIRRVPARPTGDEDLGPPSDCEEVEELRQALAQLVQRLGAHLSQAQRFAAHAAHELRTPLTMVAGELELLSEEAAGQAERESLCRVREKTLRLSALVERLLVLTAPLEEQEHRFETLALADLLSELRAELPEAQRSRVRLIVSGEGLIRGEPSLLRAAFANALDNALKFSGGAPVDVRLSDEAAAQRSDDRARAQVQVEVHDQGPGVLPAERERVFRPLYRATPSLAPGHGLGLALIGHVVRAHGGSAELVNVASGACLRILLPAWSAQ